MFSAHAPMLPSKTIADVITAKDVTKPRRAVVNEWELGLEVAMFMVGLSADEVRVIRSRLGSSGR